MSLLTVQNSEKVIASKYNRRLIKVTSSEKGTLVTGDCIIDANRTNGTYFLPILIFPKMNFKPYMIAGAVALRLTSKHWLDDVGLVLRNYATF